MNRRLFTSIVLTSLSLGALLSLLTGERRAISLDLWLAGFATWFALATMAALFAVVPLVPSQIVGFFARPSTSDVEPDPRPRDERGLELLLMRSRDNDRAFANQLRPRLISLAEHYLGVRHGVDLAAEPARASALLGELAWLIDPTIETRSPTLEEIDAFVEALTKSPGPPEAP